MVTKSTPTTFDKIELALKILAFLAVAAGGGWALYLYYKSGSDAWQDNISIETKVLLYHDKLRLLVIHVTSKNPRNSEFILDSKHGDSFKLHIQRIPMDAEIGTVITDEVDKKRLIKTIDIIDNDSGEYELLPNAELDDMNSIVLPVNTMVQITAEMESPNGLTNYDGEELTLDQIKRKAMETITAGLKENIEDQSIVKKLEWMQSYIGSVRCRLNKDLSSFSFTI